MTSATWTQWDRKDCGVSVGGWLMLKFGGEGIFLLIPYSCHGDKKSGDEPAQNNLQGRQSLWRYGNLSIKPLIPQHSPFCSLQCQVTLMHQSSVNYSSFNFEDFSTDFSSGLLWNKVEVLPSHKHGPRGTDDHLRGKKEKVGQKPPFQVRAKEKAILPDKWFYALWNLPFQDPAVAHTVLLWSWRGDLARAQGTVESETAG